MPASDSAREVRLGIKKVHVYGQDRCVLWSRMERNCLGSTRDESARASIEAVIAFLEQQVADLDAEMLELIRADSELKSLDSLLQSGPARRCVLGPRSVPGVGRVVAATLISSLPELGFAATSRLSALVGVAPMNHDSGSHRGLRFIRGGRANVRSMLYMAVQTAVKHNPALKVVYEPCRVWEGEARTAREVLSCEQEEGGFGGLYAQVVGRFERDCAGW